MSWIGDSVDRTFRSLYQRNFRLYFIGQLVSASGTWVNFTASAWLVLHLSNSGVALGVNSALLFLPVLLLGAWGGVLADRSDRRRILMTTQSAFAVVSIALFALVATGAVHLWMVYVLSLVNGIITAFDNPTRQSFYAELVGEEAVANAVSLNSAAFTGARIIGPTIAGAVIWALGPRILAGIGLCFLLDGVSYLAVIVALTRMRVDDMHKFGRAVPRDGGQLKAGLHYVWDTDELRRPLMVMSVIFAMSFNFAVLLPLLAQRTFDGNAGTFAALSALAGVGSLLGAITLANRAARPTMTRLGVFAIACGVGLAAIGAAPTLVVALAAMVPLGFSVMAFMITANTILQVNARPDMRGRVMALYVMVFLGSTPFGSPIAGWIGQHLSARVGFYVASGFAIVMGLATLAWRAGRSVETYADAEAVEAEAVPASASA
jgi:MFS family permease